MSYHLSRNINHSFNDVLEKLKDSLHKQDYLIAADIDVQGALKQKLDVDLAEIRIIGTNTPKVGYKLFKSDPKLGVLLPFSIVLHALEDKTTDVHIVDPEWLFSAVDDTSILELAVKIKSTFISILDDL